MLRPRHQRENVRTTALSGTHPAPVPVLVGRAAHAYSLYTTYYLGIQRIHRIHGTCSAYFLGMTGSDL